MSNLSEEKLNSNFVGFITKLEKYGIYTDELKNDEKFLDSLKKASAFTNEDTGGAYIGGLIEHINRIALIAYNINKTINESVSVKLESLIKVCYLHQLSKAEFIVPNDVEWELKKGKNFTFKKIKPALRTGEHSVYLCNKYKISLTEDECEAILSVDKIDDEQTRFFSGALSQILRASVELANAESRIKHKLENKK